MSDGHWRIKQYSPTTKTGFMVTSIPQNQVAQKDETPTGLRFLYHDGHVEHYPWPSIVKAEYQPPTHNEGTP